MERGGGRWMAWVRFPDGSRRTVERISKADAQRDLDELLAVRAAGEDSGPRRQRLATFGEVLDAWFEAGCPTVSPTRKTRHAREKSPNTIVNARNLAASHLRPVGKLWVDRTTTARLEAVFAAMAKQGYATSTIDRTWVGAGGRHRERQNRAPDVAALSLAGVARPRSGLASRTLRRSGDGLDEEFYRRAGSMTRWVRGLAGGVVVGLLATIVAGVGAPAEAALPQSFVGEIDDTDPSWRRPFAGNPPTTAVPQPNYHYETHAFTPTVSGEYRLTVTGNEAHDLDPFLCVYAGTFNAATPLVNALECADDSDSFSFYPIITRALVAGELYTLVVTSGFGILNPGTWGPFGPYELTVSPPPPVVSIVSRSMDEVDPGPAGLPVTVSIDSPQAEAVHIDIVAPALDGQLHGSDSARGGLDYTTSVVSVTIPAGETSTTFGVRVLADGIDEATERATFTATSAHVGSGTPFDPQAVGWITIVDDDEPQVLTVSAATVAEGNAGTTPMAVTVATTGAALHDMYVLVVEHSCQTGVPATSGTDFTTFPAPPATGARWIHLPKGESSATATIAVVGDTVFEPDEIVCLRASIAFYLQGGPGGDFSNVSPTGLPEDAFARTLAREFTGTITNDDLPPAVSASLTPSTLRVDEGATATMTVRFTPATAFPTTLSWQAVDGIHPKVRATSADYAAGIRMLTVPAGTSSATVTVATSADNLTETDEAFRVQLVGSTTPGVTIGAASTTTVTINGGQALPPPPVFPPPIFGLFG